ncbi:glycosyltransferase [Stenotrophomonas bentonitica]|uniref:glycosyltransferase n=1 Tax=Stenotrophomonas bentonitica TaxID=1450134 RepID=UPI00345E70E4
MKGLRVFVTRELFPFTAGGIGRVVANILATSTPEDLQNTAIVYVGDGVDQHAFSSVYPSVRFLATNASKYETIDSRGRRYPPYAAFSNTVLHWESVLILQALQALQDEQGDLGYVEFVDWGAAAFASTQEKLLGNNFTATTLAVRLHTTDSILADFEPRAQSVHGLSLYDIERKALADCDLIVGQLAPVSEAFRAFYGFDAEDWATRACVHTPPVLLDTLSTATSSVTLEDNTDLLFTSKLQDIKRPDVFIKGCIQFMRENPSYHGKAVFLAHSFDAAYQQSIVDLVPPDLVGRVVFAKGVNGALREKMIARSVCVFPSPWESFCLAAYEASLSGAVCVLNERNPAFGDSTPWLAWKNCVKFDGTQGSLAYALGELFSHTRPHQIPVTQPITSAPWGIELARPSSLRDEPPRVSAIIINQDGGRGLMPSVDSLLASSCLVDEVLVVDDASTDPISREVLKRLEAIGGRLRVLRLPVRSGPAAARNAGLACVDGEFVAFVRSGELLAPHFLGAAVHGLATNSSYDVVVSHHGVASTLPGPGDRESGFDYCHVHYGEARLAGLYENRFAADSFVMRTSRALTMGFDETMPANETWELLMRACQQGVRFIASSSVDVISKPAYPLLSSARGDISAAVVESQRRLLHGKRACLGALRVPAYSVSVQGSGGGITLMSMDETSHRLQELLDSETVRYTLAIAKVLSRRAPWTLKVGKWVIAKAAPMRRLVRR